MRKMLIIQGVYKLSKRLFVAEFIDMQKNDEQISVFMLDKKGKDELLKLALQKLEKGKK